MTNLSEVAKYLEGFDFPEEGASKEELASHAEEQGAPEEIVEALNGLNGDHFTSVTAVMKALGGGEDGEEE